MLTVPSIISDYHTGQTPDLLRRAKSPLPRNASVIPDNFEVTKTPSGSDSSEYEYAKTKGNNRTCNTNHRFI